MVTQQLPNGAQTSQMILERKKERKKVKLLSRARLFATLWIVGCPKLLRPWDFQGKSTGVGCHFLLQGIFPTQRLNPGLSHCRQTLYHLNHQVILAATNEQLQTTASRGLGLFTENEAQGQKNALT